MKTILNKVTLIKYYARVIASKKSGIIKLFLTLFTNFNNVNISSILKVAKKFYLSQINY